MSRRILWIEDDYYHVKGLVRPLEREGWIVEPAESALDAYQILQRDRTYDMLIVDLILPEDAEGSGRLPIAVTAWMTERYVGLGLLKWMLLELKVTMPVVVLSVAATEHLRKTLIELGVSEVLQKRGLLPSRVQEAVHSLAGGE